MLPSCSISPVLLSFPAGLLINLFKADCRRQEGFLVVFKQKKFSNKTTFEFGDETLTYTVEDKGGGGDFSFYYSDFPQNSTMKIEKNGWLKNVGLIWVAIGVLQLCIAIGTQSSLSGKGFWLFIGLICLVVYRIAITKYSVFRLENGTVYIIKDKKHDKIIEEIYDRRKKQLLLWYGEINTDNDAENEIAKFRWLQNQNVISKEEADKKIAEIELSHTASQEVPGGGQLN